MSTNMIHSPDNAIAELEQFNPAFEMAKLYEKLNKGDFSEEVIRQVKDVLVSYSELFDTGVPDIQGMDFNTVLTISNREIKVARLLKERGIYRLIQALRMVDDRGLPLWQQLVDEDGEPFERQEDVIHAFCTAAHISRPTVFSRISLYNMLRFLEYDEEDSYRLVLLHPTLLYNTLKKLGDWSWGTKALEELDTGVVRNILNYYDCDDDMKTMLDDIEAGSTEVRGRFMEKFRPVLRGMLEDAVQQPNVREASKFLDVDVMSGTVVKYMWDLENDCLVVVIESSVIDQTGKVVDRTENSVRLFADNQTGLLPSEAKEDLINRLPINNRKEIR